MEKIKLEKNELLLAVFIMGIVVAFILGMTTVFAASYQVTIKRLESKCSKLENENSTQAVQINGLKKLLGSDIGYYTHTEVKHAFKKL